METPLKFKELEPHAGHAHHPPFPDMVVGDFGVWGCGYQGLKIVYKKVNVLKND